MLETIPECPVPDENQTQRLLCRLGWIALLSGRLI